MNKTIYEINGTTGKIAAGYDVVFGWSISINDDDWAPLKYSPGFTTEQLDAIRGLFVGIVYPDELRQALNEAYDKQKAVEDLEEKQRRVDALLLKERLAAAEANAVATADQEAEALRKQLADQKVKEKQMLSRLAIAYLIQLVDQTLVGSRERNRMNRIIAFMMDMYFDLSLRELDEYGCFLSHYSCQVTVKKPDDHELAELLNGIIPFTKE
jgi:hypothetical protein